MNRDNAKQMAASLIGSTITNEHLHVGIICVIAKELASVSATTCIDYYTGRLNDWNNLLRKRYGECTTDEIGICWAANIAAGVNRGKNHKTVVRAIQNARKHIADVQDVYSEIKSL